MLWRMHKQLSSIRRICSQSLFHSIAQDETFNTFIHSSRLLSFWVKPPPKNRVFLRHVFDWTRFANIPHTIYVRIQTENRHKVYTTCKKNYSSSGHVLRDKLSVRAFMLCFIEIASIHCVHLVFCMFCSFWVIT